MGKLTDLFVFSATTRGICRYSFKNLLFSQFIYNDHRKIIYLCLRRKLWWVETKKSLVKLLFSSLSGLEMTRIVITNPKIIDGDCSWGITE